ncbi:hypothetical protein GD586_09055 [Pseudarcicella sp. GAP-15]|nr:hypothetical protein [Pseudarcicella sp. GAP-15]
MTGLILKLSYNSIGDTNIVGGICGTFFFIKENKAITANHVLNKAQFKPNEGFDKCQFWLIIEPNYIYELQKEYLNEFAEIDTTIIELRKPYHDKIRNISQKYSQIGDKCKNEGFIAAEMPNLNIQWGQQGLEISSCAYNGTGTTAVGFIKSTPSLTITANDIKLKNICGIETSYGGVVGMSGGPLIDVQTNEIIGMMSIGLPVDLKEKKSIFAISIMEIIKRV